jgi:beta-glucosidase
MALQGALNTRLAIPLVYGIDAVHGNNHLSDGVFYPHNIGLGATRDAALVEKIGRATAEEMAAIDVRWNFAPVIAVPQDTRWGRTYEGYSENTSVVTELGEAYVRGLQGTDLTDENSVIASAKHFIGDGGTAFGSSKQNILGVQYLLDQGDMLVDEATLRELFLPPYEAAIKAGARTVMASFSSWRGTKLHMHQYLLTDVLKGELGFKGYVISDWGALDQLPGAYSAQVAAGINAGVDMVMVPSEYQKFIKALTQLVQNGQVPQARIDDAVRRILTVKFEMGFEQPLADTALLKSWPAEHRTLARQAVRESLVLLKNNQQTLPVSKNTPLIFVAGQAANDIGLQSGGWSIEWQGKEGKIAAGTTILDGIKQTVSASTQVVYDRFASFDGVKDTAEVGIVVVAEKPYAEGVGDSADPKLATKDIALIENMRARIR